MIKELVDFVKSFATKNEETSFTKKTYTEHGIIALGRAQGMTEEELAFLSKSIHKLENVSAKERRGNKDTIKVELTPKAKSKGSNVQAIDENEIGEENIK